MFEPFRDDGRRAKGSKQKTVRLFLEELEGRCLLSHQITPMGGITTAPDGRIWFLEQDRLGRIDPNTGVIQEFAVGTPTSISYGLNPIAAPIVAAPDGAIWFFSNNQVARFDPATNALQTYSVPGTLMEISLAIGPDGGVWVGEHQGPDWDLVRINPGTGTLQEYAMAGGSPYFIMIAVGADGRIWTTVDFTGEGWHSYEVLNPATDAVQRASAGFPLDNIIAGSDGSIWLMGRMGNAIEVLTQKYIQRSSVVVDGPYQQDKYGKIWSQGYKMVPGPGFTGPVMTGIADFDPTTGEIGFFSLPIGPIWRIAPDANGKIWYTSSLYRPDGSYQPFVGRLDPATGLIQTFTEGIVVPPASSNNAPPAAGTTFNTTAGIDFVTAVATFTPQTPIPTSGAAYEATINWGDGTTSSVVLTVMQNGTYDVTAGHTYQKAGTYSIKVTIGTFDPANPLGDNTITVFSTANVDPFNLNML
jgi:streptogramin lyase